MSDLLPQGLKFLQFGWWISHALAIWLQPANAVSGSGVASPLANRVTTNTTGFVSG